MEEWRRKLPKDFQGEAGVVYYFNSEVIMKNGTVRFYSKPFTLNPKYGNTLDHNLKKMQNAPKVVLEGLLKNRLHSHVDPMGNNWVVWISDTEIPKHIREIGQVKIDKVSGREVSPGGIIL